MCGRRAALLVSFSAEQAGHGQGEQAYSVARADARTAGPLAGGRRRETESCSVVVAAGARATEAAGRVSDAPEPPPTA